MAEHFGEWREVSQCRDCGWTVDKEITWMSGFFVPVCPNCGESNTTGSGFGSGLFEPLVARPVTKGFFRKFVRWEEKNG